MEEDKKPDVDEEGGESERELSRQRRLECLVIQ